MMEDHEFCDDCPGCRPAMARVNPKTGEVEGQMPNDSPEMTAINKYWDEETTYAERKAFIEVTLHNSHIPVEMKLFQKVSQRMTEVLKELHGEE